MEAANNPSDTAASDSDWNESYIERHWDGDLSLPRSYWLNGSVVNAGFTIGIILLSNSASTFPLAPLAICMTAIWALYAVLSVWQFVGIWRSAGKCLEEKQANFWAHSARVMVVLGAIAAIPQFAFVAIPQISEYLDILRGDPEWEQTRVTVLPNGKGVEFSGGIRLGSASKLRQVLDSNPKATIVYLNTVGGRISEAESMAGIIRKRGLSTYVETECSSAGVLVFLAGKERIARNPARFGFHSASFPGIIDATMNDIFTKRIREAGADPTFIAKAVSTSSNSMWYPDLTTLKAQGIVTNTTIGLDFSPGTTLLKLIDHKYIEKELATVSSYRALSTREPERYSVSVSEIVALLKRGESWGVALQHINKLLFEVVGENAPYASDEALDLYLDSIIEMLSDNKDIAPLETLLRASGDQEALSWSGPILLEKIPRYPAKAEQLFCAKLLSDKPNKRAFDYKAASEDAVYVLSNLLRGTSDASVLSGIPEQRENQIKACEIWLKYYREIRQLPQPRRSQITRALLREE